MANTWRRLPAKTRFRRVDEQAISQFSDHSSQITVFPNDIFFGDYGSNHVVVSASQ
jgi:hypothetical protein